MMKPILDVTVLLPVFNERENLEPLTEEIKAAMAPTGKIYEILFINDGSTDGSTEILRRLEAEHPEVRVVEFEANFGQSAALGAGFQDARGDIIVTLDSDRQNNPEDIPKLLLVLEREDVDAVCGVRAKRFDSWLKRATSRFANWVRNKISKDTIQDTGCSLKAFKRYCLQDFFYFKGMHRFLPTLIRMHGYKVVEVLVNHRPRQKGKSKYTTRNRLLQPLIDLLAVRWMKNKFLAYKIRVRETSDV